MALLSIGTKLDYERWSSRSQLCWCLTVLVILTCGVKTAHPQELDEYQVKAAFLFHFAHYVEWPAAVFKDPGKSIVVCTLGQSPVGHALDDMVNGQALDGRRFVVSHFSNVRQVSGCHILFIGSSETKHLRSILDSLKGSGLLTVGESDSFTGDGGVISFTLADNKVRFEINVAAAEQQQLKISSKLLSLARVAKSGAGQ